MFDLGFQFSCEKNRRWRERERAKEIKKARIKGEKKRERIEKGMGRGKDLKEERTKENLE